MLVAPFFKPPAATWFISTPDWHIKGKSKGRVLYSGGVDSRSVLSLVPQSFECVPTTVLDCKNQEYRAAKWSAKLLGRELEWIPRPEDHYRASIREKIDTIGPGWDFTAAHISGSVADYFKDVDVLLGGYLADTFFKGLWMSGVRMGRFRPDRLLNPSPDAISHPDLEEISQKALWSDLVAKVLEIRQDHHRRLKEFRPKTAGDWHPKFPLSNQPHFAHYLALLRIGPSVIEPFAFSGTYRLAARMPDTARVNMEVFRRAFADEMGLAGWWPTSGGQIPALKDAYVGHGIAAAVQRWLRFRRRYFDTFSTSGPWSSDAGGWHPVNPERYFSKEEHQLLEQRLTDVFAVEAGDEVFENEYLSNGLKSRALALGFDQQG